jgi:DNA-binding transcriptional regulator YiaG
MIKKETPKLILKLRMSLGYDQGEFGNVIGVTGGTICNWERGRRWPKMIHIRALVNAAKANNIAMELNDFLEI